MTSDRYYDAPDEVHCPGCEGCPAEREHCGEGDKCPSDDDLNPITQAHQACPCDCDGCAPCLVEPGDGIHRKCKPCLREERAP